MIASENLTFSWHYGQTPEDCSKLRAEVFLDEQGFSYDKDDMDAVCYHLCVYDRDGQAVGVARMFRDGETTMHAGRIAVKKALRGQHIGRFIIACLEQKGKELGMEYLELGAQLHAVPFYENCGFTPFGELFEDDGAPHRHMRKRIQ